MELKGRLRLIYEMIPQCDTLCDIGTDHALVPAYALLNKRCRRAIASDIRKGPLERAKQTLTVYNLEGAMDLRLGNGLEAISMDEADVIVLAGMGGVLITELLDDQMDKAKKATRIILQPMYAQEVVRPFLWQHGFKVENEALTREGRKLYQVLAVFYEKAAGTSGDKAISASGDRATSASGDRAASVFNWKAASPSEDKAAGISEDWISSVSREKDPLYAAIGEGLIKKRDPLLEDWLCDRMKRQRKIVNGLRHAASPRPNLEREEGLLRDMESLHDRLFGKSEL